MGNKMDYYEPFRGSGKIYLRRYGAAEALAVVGNCKDLKFTTELDEQEVEDYMESAGGTYASDARIKSCSVSFTAFDFNTANLTRAMAGMATSVTPAAGMQSFTAYQGGLIPLAGLNPQDVTIAPNGGGTNFVEDVDYEVRPEGIYVLDQGIADGVLIDITPTSFSSHDLIEALLNSGETYELLFASINGAMGDLAARVRAHKVKFNPAEIGLITDGFGSIPFTAKVMKDNTVVGTEKSKYYYGEKAAA